MFKFLINKIEKTGLNENLIIKRAAELANEAGIEKVSLKLLAEDLQVKSPSLYNYVSGLDDLREKIMLYGWKQMEEKIIRSVIGVAGYEAVRTACHAFYKYATENPGIFNAMLWYNKFQDEKLITVNFDNCETWMVCTKNIEETKKIPEQWIINEKTNEKNSCLRRTNNDILTIRLQISFS